MTAAERQRRHRARVRREQLAASVPARIEAHRKRLRKLGKDYIPAPPGITYWQTMTVITPQGEQQIQTPMTRPLASIELSELSDKDIAALLYVLQTEQERRRKGAEDSAATRRSFEQLFRVKPGTTAYVGPYVPPELYEDSG